MIVSRIVQIFLVCGLLAGAAWAAGVRVDFNAAASAREAAGQREIITAGGDYLTGRLESELEDRVIVITGDGQRTELLKSDIAEIRSGQSSASLIFYDPEKNLFKAWFGSAGQTFNALTGNDISKEEWAARGKSWGEGMRWQTGGREEFEQNTRMAARKELGQLAHWMDKPKASDPQ